MQAERAVGVVKWYNAVKGYGFIDVEGRERDAFVHRSAVFMKRPYPTLNEGDRVAFTLNESKKGLLATSVIMIQ